VLQLAGDRFVTQQGVEAARLVEGIVRYAMPDAVDLHLPDELIDMRNALRTREVLGRKIVGEARWQSARASLAFSERHGAGLAGLAPGAVVADLGCGQIPYWHALPLDRIAAFYGFDGHLQSLQRVARDIGHDPRLVLVHSLAQRTPVPDESFDAVISSEVLEHVDDPAAYLGEIRRILRPKGVLSLSTPCGSMYLWPSEWLKVALGRVSPATLWRRLTPERRWREALAWHPALRPRVLRQWLTEAGFAVERHDSALWNAQTVLRPSLRLFTLAERLFGPAAGRGYGKYLAAMDRLTQSQLPLLRFAGLRQFVVARKQA
jgi:ubiquinone/menaquinone biosynthesis C-methylase UbiE